MWLDYLALFGKGPWRGRGYERAAEIEPSYLWPNDSIG